MEEWIWAVDLGATNLRVGLVGPEGELVATLRARTPQEGPQSVVEAIARLVEELCPRAQEVPRRMGVGVPGPLSVAEGIVHAPPNLPGWREVPLRALLEERLGVTVILENDANAAAVGEWWRGAARGARHVLYITWSTGIGGGLLVDGRIYRGASDTAGEIGHITVDPLGPLCPCGRRGHLEGIAGGRAIARAAREALARGEPSRLVAVREITAREVAEAARGGDPLARRVLERAARMMGLAVGSMLNLLNPEVVVIGGGVARSWDLLEDPLVRAAREAAFEAPFRAARILVAALEDDAGLIGAAYVALQN
ncbi:MAG: ROK family protein [Armatimonadota bacterium]|nr:ROK family protein [Armatimonadota bacterium]MDR7439113.1 ROK family protein [Armatimonadota bacterium]MDR7562166.1 ROK family protein [Armatimonadota bacterium]MDR7567113.1 ROK family protein [Armatimonadota bacterium]MDR7602966.1 ROK family protein [Armatimonadota bacterium]